MTILVSVIIPFYNSADTIDRCINSVFQQEKSNLEIICINDGSTDNSIERVRKIKENSPFPFFIIEQENKGACSARNEGLKIASGEYIQFLDADDELGKDKIYSQLNSFYKEKPDIIIAAYTKITANDKRKEFLPYVNDFWTGLIKGRAGCTCSNLFKKEILNEMNGWNENYKSSQESELMFRIFQKSNLISYDLTSKTIIYERTNGSVSYLKRAENWERAIKLRVDIWNYLKSNNLMNSERERELKIIIFDCIRILYSEDSSKAIKMFKEYVKNIYNPLSSAASSKFYIFLLKILGFKNVQKIYSIVR